MDHRCLYGHRVSASFTFAIQNRTCPVCGAPTVTLNGYQAARRLASDGGLESVVAFSTVRLLETDWSLVPHEPVAAAALTPAKALADADDEGAAARPVAAPAAAPAPLDEEVVVDESEEAPAANAVSVPDPRVKPVLRKTKGDKEAKEPEKSDFDPGEEDFFKGA